MPVHQPSGGLVVDLGNSAFMLPKSTSSQIAYHPNPEELTQASGGTICNIDR